MEKLPSDQKTERKVHDIKIAASYYDDTLLFPLPSVHFLPARLSGNLQCSFVPLSALPPLCPFRTVARAEDYRKMKESIEYQLRAGSVVLLPAYLHVEAIIQQRGSPVPALQMQKRL